MTAPIKIGVDATFLQRDQRGMGRVLRSVLNEWKKSCTHELVLLVKEKRHIAELEDSPYGKWDIRVWDKVKNIDVCWFPWNRVDWTPDCPAAVTIYDVAPFTDYHPKNRHLTEDQNRLLTAAEKADRIITTSNFSRLEMHRHLNCDISQVDVVHLGHDPVFHPHSNQYLDPFFAERIGEKPYILYVGNTEPRKNLAGLLEAFMLLENQVESRLLLVSAKPSAPTWSERLRGKTDPLKGSISRLEDRLIWLEGIDDATLAELYRRSQVFVMPSFYEGFGLPLLEAMACGAPTAAARAASLPEVGGEVPYWFVPDDPVDIARAILEAIDSPNGEGGPERATDFTWEASAGELSKILEEMARRPQSPPSLEPLP
jgi:glycosyltransferase involved in cell wall biosynthesis